MIRCRGAPRGRWQRPRRRLVAGVMQWWRSAGSPPGRGDRTLCDAHLRWVHRSQQPCRPGCRARRPGQHAQGRNPRCGSAAVQGRLVVEPLPLRHCSRGPPSRSCSSPSPGRAASEQPDHRGGWPPAHRTAARARQAPTVRRTTPHRRVAPARRALRTVVFPARCVQSCPRRQLGRCTPRSVRRRLGSARPLGRRWVARPPDSG